MSIGSPEAAAPARLAVVDGVANDETVFYVRDHCRPRAVEAPLRCPFRVNRALKGIPDNINEVIS